jgi:hypothetical protein
MGVWVLEVVRSMLVAQSLLSLLIFSALTGAVRVAFLPDVSVGNAGAAMRWFYPSLMGFSTPTLHGRQKYYRSSSSSSVYCSMNFLDMPSIYESNTKRFEVLWLQYMKDNLDLSSYDVVIGHGSSAEALLRYMERDLGRDGPLKSVVVLDAADIYTAGERHGRRYHYQRIKRNSLTNHVLVTNTSPLADAAAASLDLKSELYTKRNRDNDHDVAAQIERMEKNLFRAAAAPPLSFVSDDNGGKSHNHGAAVESEACTGALNQLLDYCISQSVKTVLSS